MAPLHTVSLNLYSPSYPVILRVPPLLSRLKCEAYPVVTSILYHVLGQFEESEVLKKVLNAVFTSTYSPEYICAVFTPFQLFVEYKPAQLLTMRESY